MDRKAMIDVLYAVARSPAARRAPTLLLAHGAGAPMDSPFMHDVTGRLTALGVTVARFEFDYMAERRSGSRRRPPPKLETLVAEYRTAIAAVRAQTADDPLFIGGKSMGGRIASLLADACFDARQILGCVCLGYPFHPAKQPEKLRTAHLLDMRCPTLIIQGERDPLGNRADVDGMTLSGAVEVVWIGDGDHDLRPRAASGLTLDANLGCAAEAVAAFATRRRTAKPALRSPTQ